MESVEKLERILHSEESARDRVREARERAVALEREAKVTAAHTRQAVLDTAREETRIAAAATIEAARTQCTEYGRQAAAERAEFIERASARVDAAVATVLSELAD